MAKYNFNLRNPQSELKQTEQKPTPINFVIRWDNQRLVHPTGISILPKFWEVKGKNPQRVKEIKAIPTYPEINSILNQMKADGEKLFNGFVAKEKRNPTVAEFKNILDIAFNKKAIEKTGLFSYVDKFIVDAESGVRVPKANKQYSPNTIRSYKYSFNYVKEYAKAKRRLIDFDTIDLDFYTKFTEYLTKEKNLSVNSIGKIIKILKVFLGEANNEGVNNNEAFRNKKFVARSIETDAIYLTEKELYKMYNLNLSKNKRLEQVRDLFYIGCLTGLRFSDFSKINKANIIKDELHIKTIKTRVSVVIPLDAQAFDIMKRYNNKFPKALSNQKMNLYIKEVCEMVPQLKELVETSTEKGGLTIIENIPKYKLVCTHTVRRSFCTNAYLKGIPVFAIMGLTGHKTESSFFKYIRMTPSDKSNMFRLYNEKHNNLKVV